MATPTPIVGSDGCIPPSCLEIPPSGSPTGVSCFSVVGYTQQPNCTGLEFDYPFDPAVGPSPTGPDFAPYLCRTWWGFRNSDGSCSQVLVQGAIAGTRPDCELPSWLAGAPLFIQQAWCDVQRFGEQYCNAPALQACLEVCARDTSETGGACLDCLAEWALSCTVIAVQNILNRSIQTVRDWWGSTRPKPPPADPPIPTSLDVGRLTGGTLRASAPSAPITSSDTRAVFSGVPHAREGVIPMVPVVVPKPGCGCDEESEFTEEDLWLPASAPTKHQPLSKVRESAAPRSLLVGSLPRLASEFRPPTSSASALFARSRPQHQRRIPA